MELTRSESPPDTNAIEAPQADVQNQVRASTTFEHHPRVVRLRSLIATAAERARAYGQVKVKRAHLHKELERLQAEITVTRQAVDAAAIADVLDDGPSLRHTVAALAKVEQLESQVQAIALVLDSLNTLESQGSRAAAAVDRWQSALQVLLEELNGNQHSNDPAHESDKSPT